MDAQEQSYSRLLEGAQEVYKLEAEPKKKPAYLILSPQSHIYLFNVQEELKIPPLTPMTVIPSRIKPQVDPVSPNGQYYFIHYKGNWLRIFSNQDKRLLREVSFKELLEKYSKVLISTLRVESRNPLGS